MLPALLGLLLLARGCPSLAAGWVPLTTRQWVVVTPTFVRAGVVSLITGYQDTVTGLDVVLKALGTTTLLALATFQLHQWGQAQARWRAHAPAGPPASPRAPRRRTVTA